jgi:N utilization substance protein A
MQSKPFFEALTQIAEERGLEKIQILEIFERGLLNAYKKAYQSQDTVRVEFNEERHEIQLLADYLVVEEVSAPNQMNLLEARTHKKKIKIGEVLSLKITPKDFGRIAAVSAKQILTQGLKQLEREKIFSHFKSLEGEMTLAEIVVINKDYITLDLGLDLETSLPRKELLKSDEVRIGSRLKVYISKVESTPKGAKVYVSRTDKNLVKRLIEQTTPEIVDGTIEIMGLARDPGSRTKVAVYSHDANVDPVGSVVGHKGNRIKEVLEALKGERVDVYAWSPDVNTLIKNSLAPATVHAIVANTKEKTAIVIVEDEHFTSAIGSKGQNVRLAAQSSGFKIDIKSISEANEAKIMFTPLNAEEVTPDEAA